MEELVPTMIGNECLLQRNKTTFLCSHKVPDETFNAIRNWTNSLNSQEDCILCGCLSGIERFTLKLLVERQIPIILVLAESLPDHVEEISRKLPDIILSDAMGYGRLLIVSINTDKEQNAATGSNAEARNRWMLATGDKVVVGHSMAYGKLESQLIGRKNVIYLTQAEAVSNPNPAQLENRGWGLYRYLRDNLETLSSVEIRRGLNEYLKLNCVRPSILHSVILQFVVRNFESLGEFKFAAFLRLWGAENLRNEDWKKEKTNGHYIPSLAERVLARLAKAEPENMDTELIKNLSEQGIRLFPRNNKYKLYRTNAAMAEKDFETARPLLKELLRMKSEPRVWRMLADCVEDLGVRCSILCKSMEESPFDPKQAWTHLLLGDALFRMKHFPEALRETEIYRKMREQEGKPFSHKYQWLAQHIPSNTQAAPIDAKFYGSHSKTASDYILKF